MTDPLLPLRKYQAGRCAMCTYARPLVVDHDHDSGWVRGFLCNACNTTEGRSDYPWVVAYRENPPAKQIGLYVRYDSTGKHEIDVAATRLAEAETRLVEAQRRWVDSIYNRIAAERERVHAAAEREREAVAAENLRLQHAIARNTPDPEIVPPGFIVGVLLFVAGAAIFTMVDPWLAVFVHAAGATVMIYHALIQPRLNVKRYLSEIHDPAQLGGPDD